MAAKRPFTPPEGFRLWPGRLDRAAQAALRDEVVAGLAVAPLFTPTTRRGQPFSVRMSNLGPLGWVSDAAGYRYQPLHPGTGGPWPLMPDSLRALWAALLPDAPPPDACLVNWYAAGARLGLHQDLDEAELRAPVLSVSLGDTAVFRMGGLARSDPTRSLRLASGDVMALTGPARLAFHGVDRVLPGSSRLLEPTPLGGGRLNLTLRRAAPA